MVTLKYWKFNKHDRTMFIPKRIYDNEKEVYNVIEEYAFKDGKITFNGYKNNEKKKLRPISLLASDVKLLEFYGDGIRTTRNIINEVRNIIYKEWFFKHSGDEVAETISWDEYYNKRCKELLPA